MKTPKQKTTAARRAKLGPFNEAEMLESVAEFVETLKAGKAHTLRSTTIELPEPLPERSGAEVRALRERLKVSQGLLAALLNVPHVTVSSWENNQRKPSGAALKLLSIAEAHPEIFIGKPAGSLVKQTKVSARTVQAVSAELASPARENPGPSRIISTHAAGNRSATKEKQPGQTPGARRARMAATSKKKRRVLPVG